jgi:flagellar basal-body rod modification protein FlgD
MDNATTSLAAGIPASMTTSSTLSSKNTAETQKTQFLKLLIAQLKGQNPLDPKDGSEFVAQLAQFSSLEELINIRTTLESLTKASPTTNSSNPFQGA